MSQENILCSRFCKYLLLGRKELIKIENGEKKYFYNPEERSALCIKYNVFLKLDYRLVYRKEYCNEIEKDPIER